MSRAQRRASIERETLALPIAQQCRLLAVSRAAVYRKAVAVSAEDLAIMALLDRQYLARPYYGSRRTAAWLVTQGHVVNREPCGAGMAAVQHTRRRFLCRGPRRGARPPWPTTSRPPRRCLPIPIIGVTQIAHRLGVSPATLYRYIPAARTANLPNV
jgi:predicted DNA-binding transcriptional regulator AlpA